ncbi:MAG: prolyl oligopeptidase family serine peptidase [Bacteroidia bacterium]|nr:prolyl oligopeptidase family serine peptidase [Bacteroidia bacterium]
MTASVLLAAATILATVSTTVPESPEGRTVTVDDMFSGKLRPQTYRDWHWNDQGLFEDGATPDRKVTYKLPQPENDDISYGAVPSRNEFGSNSGVTPSPSGALLAVIRRDESLVGSFPLLNIRTRTGSLKSVKYPMNGMSSERLALCVCDTLGHILTTLDVTDFESDRYLTNVSWSPDDRYLFVQVLDRAQHHMHLNMYRASDGGFVRTLLTEENDAWVEPENPLYNIKGTYDFIYTTDNRDGYSNLYLLDTLGTVRRIAACNADMAYEGNDGAWVYYDSREVSPVENHLFRIQLKPSKKISKYKIGKPQQLTQGGGMHSIKLSPDCKQFVDTYSAPEIPAETRLCNADGSIEKVLLVSPDPLDGFARCEVELGTVKAADGVTDNYYRLIKPLGFDPSKKYPLIVYVYGGPHSQMVNGSWLGNIRMWEMVMAQRGYVVYVQDNRGTSYRGAAFEKAINRRCGQEEAADQMAGLNALLDRSPWIDRDRIGVHGWSYGGYMTITLLTHYPDVFKVAAAGGPVIDWKWYEIMYGERYMDNPVSNPEGFEETSLMNQTSNVKGRLLIIQGAVDETVVWQHSLSFVQKCIEEGVQLEYFPYPVSEHNMRGKNAVHLYNKLTEYFLTNL